jgi:uncharacterized protein YlxW (UPF0749 family)
MAGTESSVMKGTWRGETEQELARLEAERRTLHEQLDRLNRRRFLTADEEMERKRIQKLKLLTKDRLSALQVNGNRFGS